MSNNTNDDKNKSYIESKLAKALNTDNIQLDDYALRYFPKLIVTIFSFMDPSKSLTKLYVKFMSLLNYMFVCGIGVFINQIIIHYFVSSTSLMIANFIAIFVAFTWNWTFTVGPYGYLFGFKTEMLRRTA